MTNSQTSTSHAFTDNPTRSNSLHDGAEMPQHTTNTPYDNIIHADIRFTDTLANNMLHFWQSVLAKCKHNYLVLTENIVDELLIQVQEEQINQAMNRFIVRNVDMVQELYLRFYDDQLRLYATVYVGGVFAKVACNFRLVQAQINSQYQRFVFEQLTNTEILELHSKKWFIAPVAKAGIWLYRTILRKDPLPQLLSIPTVKGEPFTTHKGRFIYLDITRYLTKIETLKYLQKAQVNTAFTIEKNLLAKVQINFDALLSFGDDIVISEKDNPTKNTNPPAR